MEKQRWEESEKRKRKKIREEKESEEKDAGARKGRNCVFPMICGSGGSKSRLAKAARCGAIWPHKRCKIARRCGAKQISKSKCAKHTILGALLEVEMKKQCTASWCEAHSEVKMRKAPYVRTTF